ncbi:hypothetical protein LNP17_14245 [Klebsiella variicola subsp. variicola]|nr:hypothetical protein [Klebsiella variicola subsp. variicola]
MSIAFFDVDETLITGKSMFLFPAPLCRGISAAVRFDGRGDCPQAPGA